MTVPPPTSPQSTADAVHPTINWHRAQSSRLTRGERAADILRNGMGSWLFVGTFLAVNIGWAAVNVLWVGWDPYPFILLNLFLSLLAGLQGAILLIAAKRQDAISAALAEHDYQTDRAAKQEIEELMAINRVQLELLHELRSRSVRSPDV